MRKSLILVAVAALSVAFIPAASAGVLCGSTAMVPTAQAFLATSTPAVQPDLFAPKPTPVRCGPYCDLLEGGTTPTEQGSGSSCTNAQASLTSQLLDLANSFCETNNGTRSCSQTLTVTVACHMTSPGVYQENGYYTFGCRDTTC
ncbi:MAG TPA: hypothetical protein VKY89_20780 [Thermoanaerobaculia bacterium]|jgi:hypothetical protein|nr:hypothetical protein [Thermoanaerobaculia bacterium]